jgi:hypothetical protein
MDGSEYNNLLRYLTKKEYNGKLTANEKRALGIKFVYNFYPSGIKYLRNFIHCVRIISFP